VPLIAGGGGAVAVVAVAAILPSAPPLGLAADAVGTGGARKGGEGEEAAPPTVRTDIDQNWSAPSSLLLFTPLLPTAGISTGPTEEVSAEPSATPVSSTMIQA